MVCEDLIVNPIKVAPEVTYPGNQHHSFSLGYTVVLLCGKEFPTGVSYDYFTATLNLSENVSKTFITCICG